MFPEESLLPLSALQHLVFCERQCALIHLEQIWSESSLTLEGREMHQAVDHQPGLTRKGVRIARGMPLRSLRLGLTGKADVVELHRVGGGAGAVLAQLPGRWQPFPVEYKRGRPKRHAADLVQICAQALCLEEMLGVRVPAGALFYGRTKRRVDVEFDAALRERTEGAARRLHELWRAGRTPKANREAKCDRCSLLELCRPEVLGRSATTYLQKVVFAP